MPHRAAALGHRVLVRASFGRDAESVAHLLTSHAYDAQVVPDLSAVAAALDEHTGAVLLTEESLGVDMTALAEALRRQPAWSDVPFVLLAARRTGPDRSAMSARLRLPEAATNVVVLERPLGTESLLSALDTALRSRQRQFDMRDRLAELAASRDDLRTSEAKFQAIADSVDQMIWATRPDGFHDYYNQRWYDFTGMPGGSTHGEAWNGMFHPDDQERAWARWRHSLTTGEPYHIEYRLRHRSGRYRWVIGRAQAARDGAGTITRWYGTCTDIDDLKVAQANLEESENRLRLATEAAAIGTWDYDPVDDTLLWDARCKELFGVPADATVSYADTFLAGIHPDDRARVQGAVERALEPGGTGDYDAEFRTVGPVDGTERWVIATGRSHFDGDRTVRFVGTVLDVSARKRAEAALAGSEAALREESAALEVLNRTAAAIAAELDLDRLVQIVVDAGRELTGAQAAAFFHEGGDGGDPVPVAYALSGGNRGTPVRVELQRARAAIVPTFGAAGLISFDDALTVPRYAAAAAERRGTPDGEVPVRSFLAVPVLSRSGSVIGGLAFGHEAPGIFPDRTHRLVAGLAAQAAIGIDNANLFRTVQKTNQTLEDMVAARTAELDAEMRRRADAESALRQSHKMEAVGQLTGGIAHDFNNMLTGVIGSIDIVRRRLAAGRTDGVDRFMDAASTSAERAASLTHRLLAFSRRQSLDSKAIDINTLVQSLQDLLRRTLSERVSLRIVLANGLPPGVADANQLENAVLNLAINARDAMPDGGELIVETSAVEITSDYVALRPDTKPGRYVLLAVSDTGVGMTPDLVEKAFEPFFTTKPIGQGTGLGLSMVYGFAKQSNGHVRIHSRPGEGTSVKLYLPAAPGLEVAREATLPVTMPAGRGETVLVIEDDESVRLLVREVLTELGYQTIEAADSGTALPILASDRHLDLMISDVGLPGLSGRQVAELARQHRPDLPILFITGYSPEALNRRRFLEPGMDMISKPFSLLDLANKVRLILGDKSGERPAT